MQAVLTETPVTSVTGFFSSGGGLFFLFSDKWQPAMIKKTNRRGRKDFIDWRIFKNTIFVSQKFLRTVFLFRCLSIFLFLNQLTHETAMKRISLLYTG